MVVLSVAACSSGEESAVADAAAGFHDAIARRDGEAACDLLAR